MEVLKKNSITLFFAGYGFIVLCIHLFYQPSMKQWCWGFSTWESYSTVTRIVFISIAGLLFFISSVYLSVTNKQITHEYIHRIFSKFYFLRKSVVLLPVLFIMFYVFRTRVFYGDANVNFYRGIYANFLTWELFQLFTRVSGFMEWSDIHRIAIFSSLCGTIYFLGIRGLLNQIFPDKNNFLPILFLLTIIPVQLFFGYVEVYFTLAAVIPFYLCAGVLCLRDRKHVLYPAGCLVLAMLFHLSAVWLIFSFLYIFIIRNRNNPFRLWIKKLLPLIVFILITLLLVQCILFVTVYKFNWQKYCWDYTHREEERTFRSLGGGGDQKMFVPFTGDAYSLGSATHLSDFMNELLFLSPMFFPLFFCGIRISGVTVERQTQMFLLFAAAGFTAYSFFWKSDLGFPRDWDLFASTGIVLSITAVSMFMMRRGNKAVFPLLIAIALNIFHTTPWISANALGKGKERNKIFLSLGGPVDLHRYTVLRNKVIPAGSVITIPVKRISDISAVKLRSEVKHDFPAQTAITRMWIECEDAGRILLNPVTGKKNKRSVQPVELNHQFRSPVQPVAVHLQCIQPVSARWMIRSLILIQAKGTRHDS